MRMTANRSLLFAAIADVLLYPPDVNAPGKVDIPGEVYPEGDMPAQMGDFGPTLLPGIDTFIIPANIAQLWDTQAIKDSRPGSPTLGQPVNRLRLKFDRNSPLTIADGTNKDETMTATFTGNPRPRGKMTDPATPWVSDLAYFLEIGLGDKSRPKTPDALKAQINKYAGKTVRLEHGLSAHCREDKVRYILDPADDTGTKSILDPAGTKGCSNDQKPRADNPKRKMGRYYTDDFKDPEAKAGEPAYTDTLQCDCGAVLRGFPSVERFLPPLGVAK